MRVSFAGDEARGSCDHASARGSRCRVFPWCLRDRVEHRLVRPTGQRSWPRWRASWRGCASGPTGGTTAGYGSPSGTTSGNGPACGTTSGNGPACGTTSGDGPACGTSGNGAARGAGVPCGSPATAPSHGAASCSTAYRRTAATGRTARCRATPRNPACSTAAATGHDESSRAAHRCAIAPERISRCGGTAVANGTDRNACAAARAAHPAATANCAGAAA
jgi:hypothetical protein